MDKRTGGPSTSRNAAHWRRLRAERMRETRERCERCGRHGDLLELHHRTYERFGYELAADVNLLCVLCHRLAHRRHPELVRPEGNPRARRVGSNRRDCVRAIVKVIRMGTVCETCHDPAKVIQWHNDEHSAHPERRVGRLVGNGKSLEIVLDEIERCMALCLDCHAALDGRGPRLGHSTDRSGEANGRAKLTDALVAEIRASWVPWSRDASTPVLARRYGVSQSTVSHIVRGRRWRNDYATGPE